MPDTAPKDFSTTAASNSTVGGINIAEGSTAAQLNDAIRATLAVVKTGDWGSAGIAADVIAESTTDAGVTIDGLLIKDGSAAIQSLIDSNGNEVLTGGETADAVNEVTITNNATGEAPTIAATGDDTNIDLAIDAKGNGNVVIGENSGGVVLGPGLLTFPASDGSAKQVIKTDGSGTLSFESSSELETAIATTSGTSHTFSSIAAGTTKITIMLAGVSTNGTSNLLLRIGDSGGLEESGYLGAAARLDSAAAVQGTNHSTAFILDDNVIAAEAASGVLTLTLMNASTNLWVINGVLSHATSEATRICSGHKALSGTLDRVSLTTAGGTDAFDAGSFNIRVV